MNGPLSILRAQPRTVYILSANVGLPRPRLAWHAYQLHRRNFTTPAPPGHQPAKRVSPTNKTAPAISNSNSSKPHTSSFPELPHARHEVHEGTASISMPFNPPGGGPSAAPSGFTFTNSPVLDAILTTAIGLAAGKYSNIWQRLI